MFHKMLILKMDSTSFRVLPPPPSRESILRRNWFSHWMDSAESMPGVHKSLKAQALNPYAKAMKYRLQVMGRDEHGGFPIQFSVWTLTALPLPLANTARTCYLRPPSLLSLCLDISWTTFLFRELSVNSNKNMKGSPSFVICKFYNILI
jgi:hypothetical protein